MNVVQSKGWSPVKVDGAETARVTERGDLVLCDPRGNVVGAFAPGSWSSVLPIDAE